MRILYVAPFGLGQKSTVWARTLPLAQQMADRGAQAAILIPPWDTPQDAGRRWQEGSVDLVNVSLSGGLPGILARMAAHIRRAQPDILHIVKPRAHAGLIQWLAWYAGPLLAGGKGGKRPRLFLDVDDWEQAWSAIGGYGPITARFLDWQERWGLAHAHAITAASHWLTDHVRSRTPHIPVLYLPNGITPPTHSRPAEGGKSGDGPTSVLLFSRFVEVSPAWMAALWRHLRQLRPDAILLVAGQGLQPGQEAAFRAALGGAEEPSVRWLGYVAGPELDRLYAQADCAIFPADQTPLNQAKCSVRLANTLLRGVPVVASAVGEQAHYAAAGAARLVPADASPVLFAQAVADLLADPAARSALSSQARHRLLTTYDWGKLGDQLWDFYVSNAKSE
jgi:glycosyltransferase involved in cell wall biosynthesis